MTVNNTPATRPQVPTLTGVTAPSAVNPLTAGAGFPAGASLGMGMGMPMGMPMGAVPMNAMPMNGAMPINGAMPLNAGIGADPNFVSPLLGQGNRPQMNATNQQGLSTTAEGAVQRVTNANHYDSRSDQRQTGYSPYGLGNGALLGWGAGQTGLGYPNQSGWGAAHLQRRGGIMGFFERLLGI